MSFQESLTNLKKHSVVKTITIYIFISWVALQAIDIIFPIIGLTAYYQRWFLLLALIGLPITSLFAWYYLSNEHMKSAKRRAIVWSFTFLITISGIFIGYKAIGKPMTQIVAIENEAGETERMEVLQDRFVKGVVLFSLKNESSDKQNDWIGNWISTAILYDLNEFTYINPIYGLGEDFTLGKMQQFAQNNAGEYFVEGDFNKEGESITLNIKMYDASNAKLINKHKRTFAYSELSAHMDSLSLKIRQWSGLSDNIIDSEIDLRISETLTENDSAAKYFALGNYQMALYHDSTFAYAAFNAAYECYVYQCGKAYNQKLIDIAMKNRARIGKIGKLSTLLMYYAVNEEREKSIRLLDNQLKLQPKRLALLSYRLLFANLWNLDDYLEYFSRLQSLKELSEEENVNAVETLINQEKYTEAKKLASSYKQRHPTALKWDVTLGSAYMASGNYELALDAFLNYELNNPDDHYIQYMIKSVQYYLANSENYIAKRLKEFKGLYRITYTELTIDVKMVNYYLNCQAENGRAFPLYLINDSSCVQYLRREDYGTFLQLELKGKDKTNTIDRLAYWQIRDLNTEKLITDFPDVMWYKVDSSLDAGLLSLQQKEYQKAKKQFQLTLKQHPSYYFVEEYLKHIEFMTSEQFVDDRQYLMQLAGTYGKREIFIENGDLMYRRLGTTEDRMLYPMADGFLKLANNNDILLELVKDGNQIIGLQGWYYNKESMKYLPYEKDYSPRNEGSFNSL